MNSKHPTMVDFRKSTSAWTGPALDTIHQMDALEGLKQLPGESVDLIVTDPPYNIASPGKLTMRKGKFVSTDKAFGKWDTFHPFDYDLLICCLLSQGFRILKPGGGFYLFTAREQSGYFARQAGRRGFNCRNTLAMVKKNPMPSLHRANWRQGFELCLYLSKGTPKTFNFLSQPECVNVLHYSNHDLVTDHPTEKPLVFIRRLIAVSSNPGEVVLDPFMGSGTTAVASQALGRHFLGFELNTEYLDMARARLQKTAPEQSSQ